MLLLEYVKTCGTTAYSGSLRYFREKQSNDRPPPIPVVRSEDNRVQHTIEIDSGIGATTLHGPILE